MASAYRQGKRPQDRLHAEHDHRALEGKLELATRLLLLMSQEPIQKPPSRPSRQQRRSRAGGACD
jgi:hypothetical protein